jgi:hypothetical protein
MKYLCLIYDDENVMNAMPQAEQDAFMGEYYAFTDGIRQSGQYVAGEARRISLPSRGTPSRASPGNPAWRKEPAAQIKILRSAPRSRAKGEACVAPPSE